MPAGAAPPLQPHSTLPEQELLRLRSGPEAAQLGLEEMLEIGDNRRFLGALCSSPAPAPFSPVGPSARFSGGVLSGGGAAASAGRGGAAAAAREAELVAELQGVRQQAARRAAEVSSLCQRHAAELARVELLLLQVSLSLTLTANPNPHPHPSPQP